MDADQAVRSYKNLSNVERAFRSFKTVDLMVRPIRHHLENRVRAHIFLCLLAYYVQWHMAEAWRPMLYADEDQQAKDSRDPVAPAKRSEQALQKVHTKELPNGSRVHSWRSLLNHLSAIVRNTCRCAAWAVARAALGLAHSNPVGRLIACAAETAAIHKGFQQMNAMPVLSLPVGADAP